MISSFSRVFVALAGVATAAESHNWAERAADPYDYSWIKKYAAVGDSFTAGIGSGDIYSETDDSYACSRYDYTWPVLVNNYLGASVSKFQYLGCSGAISTGIFEQIAAMDSGQDLVLMTAGGNDLCLSTIIGDCIAGVTPSDSECQAAVAKAQSGLATYFKPNIKDLLVAIDAKMNKNGVVVMPLYAQYFNTDSDDCDSENWQIIAIPDTALPLTQARRKTFNALVESTNTALQEVIDDVASSAVNAVFVSANWDPWAPIIQGQFCEPGADPDPTAESNANVMFFKTNTGSSQHDLKRRADWETSQNNASMRINPNPLYERDPVDPGCTGGSSIPIPDAWGKIFHPSGLGHEVIAAFTLEAIAVARGTVLGIAPTCANPDDTLQCWSAGYHNTFYVSAEAFNNNIKDFCGQFVPNLSIVKYGYAKSYYVGTPDEYEFVLSTTTPDDPNLRFDINVCEAAFSDVINGCDIPSGGNNPMNWKQGGEKREGVYVYAAHIKRNNRPWPPPDAPTQSCEGWYKFFYQQYDIYGAGWANYDYGQKLAQEVNPCCGSGSLTGWHFEYFDAPDDNGYEWHAWFKTAIGTRRRCFDNNKVQCPAGGPCNSHCGGNG